jgi:hypothetical protein
VTTDPSTHHRSAPPASKTSRLACFGAGGIEPRVYYVDGQDHVLELALISGRWFFDDLTALAGAPNSATDMFESLQIGKRSRGFRSKRRRRRFALWLRSRARTCSMLS